MSRNTAYKWLGRYAAGALGPTRGGTSPGSTYHRQDQVSFLDGPASHVSSSRKGSGRTCTAGAPRTNYRPGDLGEVDISEVLVDVAGQRGRKDA